MKNWARGLVMLEVIALLLGYTGFAWASEQAASSEQAPLRIVHYADPDGQVAYEQGLCAMFERFTQETGIRYELITQPWDQLDRVLLAGSQANEPLGDLFIVSSQKLEYFVNRGALMPLDDFFADTFARDTFLPITLSIGTSSFDGKMYLMPISLHTRGLWYNRDYIEEPPRTLNELIEMAREIAEKHEGVYGLGFWGGNHYSCIEGTLSMLTWAYGGELADDAGRAVWNNEAVIKSVTLMSDMVHVYRASPEICLTTTDGKDVQEMFHSGEIAMMMDGSFAWHSSDRFSFAPMPGLSGPSENFSNAWAWGIPQGSAQSETAWRFIAWTQSKSFQIEHALLEGSLPTRMDALEDDTLQGHPLMPLFTQNLLEYGRSMDPFVYYAEAMDAIATVANDYCLDPGRDLEEMLRQSQELFNEEFY